MKLLMYNEQSYEQANFDRLAEENGVQIDMVDVPLSKDTVDLANGYDAITVQQHSPIPDEIVYQKLSSFGIKQISLRTTGFEIINFEAAKESDIKITNVPAYSPRSVSELVLADVMALLRHLKEVHNRQLKNDFSWDGIQAKEIHNLTVGIIGAGTIGSAVARIFRALGATVLVADPIERTDLYDTVEYVTYDHLLANSDVVTMHTPLTKEMEHFMNYDRFKKMKNDAIFINASRGGVVDTDALVSALKVGEIGAAGIDVFEGEETISGINLGSSGYDNDNLDELIQMDNVLVTPHIGFYTDAAVANMDKFATEDAISIYQGKQPKHLVEFE